MDAAETADQRKQRLKKEKEASVDHFASLEHNRVNIPHPRVMNEVSVKISKYNSNSPHKRVATSGFSKILSINAK